MKTVEQAIKNIRNKRLLIVNPHPDDETVWGAGLMVRLKRLGWKVVVVSVTNGIRGKIFTHGRGRSMMEIRRQEMNEAMRVLGVAQFDVWHWDDGTLKQSRLWRKDVENLWELFKPGLVVTYDFSGISGHPDHIALSREVSVQLKNKENIGLWWFGLPEEERRELLKKERTVEFVVNPSVEIMLSKKEVEKKVEALKAHESQDLKKIEQWTRKYKAEWFSEVDLARVYKYKYVNFKID